MTTQFLAEAAADGDAMISGAWMLKLIAALFTGAALVLGRYWGRKEEARKITVQDPVPEVPVKRVYSPPSFSQHMDLVRRIEVVEGNVAELRRDQAIQFLKLMEVGERRKDDILERFDVVARGFHDRVDQIIKEQRKGDA